jgi:hypothetical protein
MLRAVESARDPLLADSSRSGRSQTLTDLCRSRAAGIYRACMAGGSGKASDDPPQERDETDALVGDAARVESVQGLARLLRALRRRHARQRRDSELSYRELSERTGWSRAAIAEYLSGRTLPPTDRLDGLLRPRTPARRSPVTATVAG